MNEEKTTIHLLINDVKGYVARKDRGALADLRRGFSASTAHRAWPYLAKRCDLIDEATRAVFMLVAAGLATFDGVTKSNVGNMGATLRGIAIGKRRDKAEALKSFDGRFRRLLTCRTAQEVCERLPGILKTAKTKNKAVDFLQLGEDLLDWGDDAKVRWAKGYWAVAEEEEIPE